MILYFRPNPKAGKRNPKSKSKAEEQHLARVASLGCIICKAPANIHHIRSGMGLGMRASHYQTIPLCHHHHQGAEGIHTLGTKRWQAKYGNEVDLLERIKQMLGL